MGIELTEKYIPAENLRCPNCFGNLILESNNYRCKKCSGEYRKIDRVYHLLSKNLEECKVNEDSIHSDANPEKTLVMKEPWRFLLERKMFILRFEAEILDKIKEGNFLELGAETCWASSLVKLKYPRSTVYASDISPNALKNMGGEISNILGAPIDYLITCDAENIPFRDDFFDSIIMFTALHHLPHPEKMLEEVRRVLKKGGILITVDGAIPKLFRFLFQNKAEERAKKHGITENLISFGEWTRIVKEGGMPENSLIPYTNPKYVEGFIPRIGASVLNKLPKMLIKHVFPVGIVIQYKKL